MRLSIIILVVVAVLSVNVHAQDYQTETNQQPLVSFVKVEGKTCIASSADEFEVLTAMVKLIKTLKIAKSHGTIDSTMYSEKVTSIMKDARTAGIRMRSN